MRKVSAPQKFLFKFRSSNFRGPRCSGHHDTHSQSSTHHHEAVSAVWLISKLQPEYFETSNPETLPNGNFHISRIQKRGTHAHTQAQNENALSLAAADKHTGCQVNYVHPARCWSTNLVLCYIWCWTHRCIWKWGHLLVYAWKIGDQGAPVEPLVAQAANLGQKM